MTAIHLQPGSIFAEDFSRAACPQRGRHGRVRRRAALSVGSAARPLKLMQPQLVRDPIMRKRLSRSPHRRPHRQRPRGPGQAAGVDSTTGYPWMAMELLEGADLDTVLRTPRRPTAPEVQIFKQFCHALAAAHAAGIVHREPTVLSTAGLHFSGARRAA